jgi:hypothetical protein
MNLKKNNGFVGVDISVALVILIILVPTITGIIYNINKKNNSIKRHSQASNIAVNVIENAKGIEAEDLDIEKWKTEIENEYSQENIKSNSDNIMVLEIDDVLYQVELSVIDYNKTNLEAEENKVKTVKVIVTYKVGGEET